MTNLLYKMFDNFFMKNIYYFYSKKVKKNPIQTKYRDYLVWFNSTMPSLENSTNLNNIYNEL